MDSTEVIGQWAEKSGAYSPEYYAHHGPNETSESIRELLDEYVGTDATVLELGCSSGRHLAHLLNAGYEDLHGIDVNPASFEVMERAYPDLAETGTFYEATIEETLPSFADGEFDAVFSVESLQHVHPDRDWAFAEVARVASDLVITAESEDELPAGETVFEKITYDDVALFFRDWERVFTGLGLEQVAARDAGRYVLRAFRSPA